MVLLNKHINHTIKVGAKMANLTQNRKGAEVNVQPLRTQHEINSFIEALEIAPKTAARNKLLFILGIHTGLRMGDIVKLRIEDVRGKSSFTIQEGKTKKRRTVHLDAIMADIADFLADKPETGWLFPSLKGDGHITVTQVYRIMADAGKAIGRDDIGTHTCRKTFGYHYYQRTKDVATLMEVFNHSNQATTKRYIGIRDDEIKNSLKNFRLF